MASENNDTVIVNRDGTRSATVVINNDEPELELQSSSASATHVASNGSNIAYQFNVCLLV